MENLVLYESKNGTAYLTINRPKQLNALNEAVLEELESILEKVEEDKSLRCLIITGSGDKAFVAGADTKVLETLNPETAITFAEKGNRVFRRLEKLSIPTIAAINGYALGGGLELAMSCDIRLASENAVVGLPETSLGIFPGWGGTQRLQRIVGYATACEMIFTCNKLNAATALEKGIVSYVYPQNELLEEATKLAEKMCIRAPIGIALAKKAMQGGREARIDDGIELEQQCFSQLFLTEDAVNGLKAFNNREKYAFKGE